MTSDIGSVVVLAAGQGNGAEQTEITAASLEVATLDRSRTSHRVFRRLAAQRLEQQGAEGVRLSRLACELGVVPRTMRRMAEEPDRGFVLVEQTVTLALEDLNDYQRDNLPYLTVGKPSAGMVTLKAEPRVMLRREVPAMVEVEVSKGDESELVICGWCGQPIGTTENCPNCALHRFNPEE